VGIDIYAKWRNQTKEEEQKQYTGFRIDVGSVGYLREAYHGEPYATRHIVKEAFKNKSGKAKIPAKKLRERLQETIELVKLRHKTVYNERITIRSPYVKSYIQFVELCEKMEKRNGEPVTIIASY